MLLLISDANILIDMDTGGLLAPMFSMEYRFAVPDVLYVEEDLRVAAESEGVEVRGMLWLVTEMVRTNKISTQVAPAAYQHMRDGGRRLPWDEAERFLASLDGQA